MRKQVNGSLSTENCNFILSNLVANDLVDDPDAETVDPVHVQADTEEAYSVQTDHEEADPFQADPEEADPFQADPEEADPFQADPEEADPFQADPFPIESTKLKRFKCKLKLFSVQV